LNSSGSWLLERVRAPMPGVTRRMLTTCSSTGGMRAPVPCAPTCVCEHTGACVCVHFVYSVHVLCVFESVFYVFESVCVCACVFVCACSHMCFCLHEHNCRLGDGGNDPRGLPCVTKAVAAVAHRDDYNDGVQHRE
jgi:hypothetical protein